MLIGDDGTKYGVVSRDQAFFLAADMGLDLVEVSAQATPPVVRMIDYNKQRYEEEKRARKHRAKQRVSEVKEIKLSFKMGEHDRHVRLTQAGKFIAKGHRIKLFMRLIGRENAFGEQAKEKLESFATALGAEVEQLSRQGGRVTAILK